MASAAADLAWISASRSFGGMPLSTVRAVTVSMSAKAAPAFSANTANRTSEMKSGAA